MITPSERWVRMARITARNVVREAGNVDRLAVELAILTPEEAEAGLALLGTYHAATTRGNVRHLPDDVVAELVCTAADEDGLPGAIRVADAFNDAEVRAALGNLAVIAARQRHETRAAEAAFWN